MIINQSGRCCWGEAIGQEWLRGGLVVSQIHVRRVNTNPRPDQYSSSSLSSSRLFCNIPCALNCSTALKGKKEIARGDDDDGDDDDCCCCCCCYC